MSTVLLVGARILYEFVLFCFSRRAAIQHLVSVTWSTNILIRYKLKSDIGLTSSARLRTHAKHRLRQLRLTTDFRM